MSTASDDSGPSANDVNVATDKPVRSSSPCKKRPAKVPKKIHKAEREKLKREHLNDLFLELGNTLEPAQQNNGKASILSDATRLLRDLLAQVECLKKDNAALLSESHYVTVEKNELIEDTCALEDQIGKLQTELEQRVRSQPTWNINNPSQLQPNHNHHHHAPQVSNDHHMLPVINDAPHSTPPVLGPVIVIPFPRDLQTYQNHDNAEATASKVSPNVSRPHARYPTPSDSWPSKILATRLATNQVSCSAGTSSGTGCRDNE